MKYTLIADIISGGTPKTSEPTYWGGNIPWLSVVDFNNDDKFVYSTEKHITEEGLKNSSTKLLQTSDIIISARGTVGALAMLASPMAFNQSCFGIRSKKNIVDNDYLFYLTRHKINELKSKSKIGNIFNSISIDTFNWIEVDLPSLPEQKRIASILSALDNKIALNRQINQNLEALARQLYDYWFVQFDFPNEEGKPYKSSGGKMVYNPILKREIPEGWEVKEMEEIIDIKSGFPFQSTTYLSKGKYSIITIKNVQDGFLDLSGTDFLDELPPRIPDYCILKRGDILISLTGNIGRVGRVFSDNLLLNQRVGYVDCKNQYNNWAYLYITSSQVRLQIEKLGIGSAQLNVSPIQIGKIKLALPTDQVLSSFDKKLAAILEHILANSNEIASLTKQRDELLPLLMNGQVNFDLSDD